MQKYNLRNSDVVSGAILAALGAYIVTQARFWNYYNPDGPGPGFFPTWYGLLMIGLALALIISTAMKPKPQEQRKDWVGTRRALITWLTFTACVAVMGVLGFRLSFALFTFLLVAFVFQRTLVTAALTAVGATAAFYIVFPVLLGVQLPTGWFGF
ncbi:MAG: putative tricarboxylic transport rane protein [Alphaproteobacteria bacterium]|jgi:putative tricarboxylic transport membrane protein|nr:putative tricarboxylic transport rane protein [Alphaproteobacteria bacterium]